MLSKVPLQLLEVRTLSNVLHVDATIQIVLKQADQYYVNIGKPEYNNRSFGLAIPSYLTYRYLELINAEAS